MENNFFRDIWNYLYDVYLAAEPSENLQNLGFAKSPLFSLRLTVLGIFVGIIIAIIAMMYDKLCLGKIARSMIALDALSPEKAKTLEELGLKNKFFSSHAVRKNVGLRRFVKCVEEEEFYREQNQAREKYENEQTEGQGKKKKFKDQNYLIDSENAHFYIPEELRIKAEIRFEKKGSGVLVGVIVIVLVCVLFFLLLLFLPQLLIKLNDAIGNIKK